MSTQEIPFPEAGEKESGLLAFEARTLSGYEWPYFAISGLHEGPRLCLLGGIHGTEYPPIDAVIRFCRDLDPVTLHGRIIAIPVVNLPAFTARTPFVCPIDGKNPNRVFPGDPSGSFTEALAFHIFEAAIRPSAALIDLHCGDMVEDLAPFSLIDESGDAALDQRALDLALAFGLPNLAIQPPTGGPVAGSTTGAAAAAGVPAIIAEAGAIGQLQPEAVALHLRGLRRALQHLGMLEGTPAPLPPPRIYRRFLWIRAERGGFFRKAIAAGDAVEEGAPLGEMVDLWGEPVATISSPAAGLVLFVTTSPAIADNGLIAGIGAA